jgi:molybdate transport system ATP-binding protein
VPGIGVTLNDCSLRLGGRAVLQDVSLRIRPGEKWLLGGPNGAGKTQLVKLLAGLRWPTADGRARRSWQDDRGRDLDAVDARGLIAYVGAESQDKYARYGWNYRIAEVVTTGLFGTDIPLDVADAAQRRRVQALLERFALAEVAGRRMLEVSYGQRRLALVARAVAARPRLLLLDEVFNGLDAGHRARLRAVLTVLLRRRLTLVATAHRPEDIPPAVSHAAWVEQGRLLRLPLAQATRRLGRAADATARPARSLAGSRQRGVVIQLSGVSVYREETRALRALDWRLEDGEHWVVTGRNGSGKSTFMGLLYGAHPAALGGSVLRRGHPPGTPLEDIRRGIGIVSPELQAGYDAGSTLEEIVVSGLRGSIGLDEPATRVERSAARRALDHLDLLPLAGRLPREVSYGELRLALIARAWVHSPALLLLDEPFTGLDPGRRARLKRALTMLAGTGTQLVMAVHHHDDLPPCVRRRLHLVAGQGREHPLRPARGSHGTAARRKMAGTP